MCPQVKRLLRAMGLVSGRVRTIALTTAQVRGRGWPAGREGSPTPARLRSAAATGLRSQHTWLSRLRQLRRASGCGAGR